MLFSDAWPDSPQPVLRAGTTTWMRLKRVTQTGE